MTIKGQDGEYYGYVKSETPSCESGRTVNVYKMLGESPDPSDRPEDRLGHAPLRTVLTRCTTIGNSGFKKGKFYAQVKKSGNCGGDLSPVISR